MYIKNVESGLVASSGLALITAFANTAHCSSNVDRVSVACKSLGRTLCPLSNLISVIGASSFYDVGGGLIISRRYSLLQFSKSRLEGISNLLQNTIGYKMLNVLIRGYT